ncbi:MAG: hypothetical protein IT289_09770 [Oligoflexia bacterium]|nr:hypothetical protein [Oligoflexia bacterium]
MIYQDSLLAVEINGVAQAMTALQNSLGPAVKLLDFNPLGQGRVLILLDGTKESLMGTWDKLQNVYAENIFDHALMAHPHESLLPAVFAQVKESVVGGVLVLETSTISSLLEISNECLNRCRVNVIDIRVTPNSGGHGVAYFTGDAENLKAAKSLIMTELNRRGTLLGNQILAPLHPELQTLF